MYMLCPKMFNRIVQEELLRSSMHRLYILLTKVGHQDSFCVFFVIVTSPENDGCSRKFHRPQISKSHVRALKVMKLVMSIKYCQQED